MGDSTVIDFAAAHAAVQTPASTLTAPTDMKDVIARYNAGVRQRIVDVMAAVARAGAARPAYVYDLGAVPRRHALRI